MNNIILLVGFFFCFLSCSGDQAPDTTSPDSTPSNISSPVSDTIIAEVNTVRVDLSESIIHWKGTKMRGMGKHEGKIALEKGYFIFCGKTLCGGNFTVDMNSMNVTDIPEHEPVPRKNLINHLRSDEFFDVDKFPVARFLITHVETETDEDGKDIYVISGDLTIKSSSHPIQFTAQRKDNLISALFEIDRFKWDIAYRGSWINRNLVDKEISFEVRLRFELAD